MLPTSGSREGREASDKRGAEKKTEGEDVTEPLEEDEEDRHVHQDNQHEGCTSGKNQHVVVWVFLLDILYCSIVLLW